MTKTRILNFDVIIPRQGIGLPVFTFAARAADIIQFARIERAGRSDDGVLQGFQRPQIASHIREIRDYLEKPTAILPNAIVVAFTGAATLTGPASTRAKSLNTIGRLSVDISNGPPGWLDC